MADLLVLLVSDQEVLGLSHVRGGIQLMTV